MEKATFFLIVLAGILLVLLGIDPTIRYKEVDGVVYQARFIRLPGYITVSYPEDTIQLKDWVGTKAMGLRVTADGVDNPELAAGLALRAFGLASPEHVLEQADGHWLLRKPARTERYFTLRKFWRISAYTPVH